MDRADRVVVGLDGVDLVAVVQVEDVEAVVPGPQLSRLSLRFNSVQQYREDVGIGELLGGTQAEIADLEGLEDALLLDVDHLDEPVVPDGQDAVLREEMRVRDLARAKGLKTSSRAYFLWTFWISECLKSAFLSISLPKLWVSTPRAKPFSASFDSSPVNYSRNH